MYSFSTVSKELRLPLPFALAGQLSGRHVAERGLWLGRLRWVPGEM